MWICRLVSRSARPSISLGRTAFDPTYPMEINSYLLSSLSDLLSPQLNRHRWLGATGFFRRTIPR